MQEARREESRLRMEAAQRQKEVEAQRLRIEAERRAAEQERLARETAARLARLKHSWAESQALQQACPCRPVTLSSDTSAIVFASA